MCVDDGGGAVPGAVPKAIGDDIVGHRRRRRWRLRRRQADAAAKVAEVLVADGEGVAWLWEGARVDSVHILGEGVTHRLLELAELAYELWHLLVVQPEEVVEDLHLARGTAARADADRGDGEQTCDALGDFGGHHLEHDREAPRRLQRECVLEQARRLGARAPLHAVAAEGRVRLWREADMAHDGDSRIDERANLRHHTPTSLELDRVRSPLLDKPHAVARRILRREVRAKGEVAYEQRAARARGRGTAVVHHLVHSHLGRVLAPEHHHAHRVPHEQHVHARAVGDARARVVIGGHHADRLLARVLEA
jgi:hypothetical protein